VGFACERGGEVGFARVSGLVMACLFTGVLDVIECFCFDSSCFGNGAGFGDGAGVGVSSTSVIGPGSRCVVLKSNITTASKQET
jgi:hypothetical protein